MARPTDLYGVAGLGALLEVSPAADRDRLFRLEPRDVRRRAGLDCILTRPRELAMLGQHLQRGPVVEPDRVDVSPQCAVQICRRPATLIGPAPLQRSIAAEGMSERTESGEIQPTGE